MRITLPSSFRFLSTPSARRATQRLPGGQQCFPISIHALREEGDFQKTKGAAQSWDFYPRPPRGGRPIDCFLAKLLRRNFYPRPPRGGRPVMRINNSVRVKISIHALREEGDPPAAGSGGPDRWISIHALREEGDTDWGLRENTKSHFYPRPPRGGRPAGCPQWTHFKKHFYPRPPRGGRPPQYSF